VVQVGARRASDSLHEPVLGAIHARVVHLPTVGDADDAAGPRGEVVPFPRRTGTERFTEELPVAQVG
jgi:hypothetical protein